MDNDRIMEVVECIAGKRGSASGGSVACHLSGIKDAPLIGDKGRRGIEPEDHDASDDGGSNVGIGQGGISVSTGATRSTSAGGRSLDITPTTSLGGSMSSVKVRV